ncbi:MAG: acyl-[ACP]--phospholipid O-acyltransferase [Hyphomicrobiaceae bacterium]|nr:acyl-[ACP]--phospholipid O-acyltransferase [Hyphomicrobiaceae bacterium]
MFTSLMTSRRFAPLFWTQFLSALNDNFVKNALVILILFQLGTEQSGTLVALAGAVLVAPFFIFSGIGGEFADRYDKAEMAELLKRFEIPVAVISATGFILHSVPILFVALGLYGTIAALFGPIKYGILPVHLSKAELPAGNALVESATFAAILLGTIAGGMLAGEGVGNQVLAGLAIVMAVACWLISRLIPKTGDAAPELVIDTNPWSSTVALLRDLRADRRLWVGGLITAWFWLVGAAAMSLLPPLFKDGIGAGQGVVTLALVVFTVGIAIGSALAARASRTRPNLALVPVGAALMGLFCFDLALAVSGMAHSPQPLTVGSYLGSVAGWRVLFDFLGLSVAGGLYIVPSFAAVQMWAPEGSRARVIAGCNVLSAAFMTVASLLIGAALGMHVPFWALVTALGLGNLIAAGLILRAWGREGLQDLGLFLFNTFLGLEVKGRENLPAPGQRAIIAPNHVSLLDAAVMYSILPSHSSFAIDTAMAQQAWVKPFLKLVKAQAIDPTKPIGTRSLINSVKDGETLVIFPEGRLTVTGGLMKVYDGTAMIADKADAVVVPVRIDGLERSYFGYLSSSQTKRSFFPKTTVTILPAVKLDIDPALKGKARRQAAGAELQDIMVDTAVMTAPIDQSIFEALVLAKQTRDTGKIAVEDPLGTKLSYRKLILSAQVLGRKLERYAGVGAAIGVMLPNSAGVAVTFFALQAIGRVPAMLNFTAGAANLEAACRAAKVNVILTSRAFVEKARLADVVMRLDETCLVVYLEDIKADITFAEKIAGLRAGSAPQVQRRPDDPAAILFTSGSEGSPKGVVLSHRNLLANCMQSLHRVAVNGEDKVFNVLPVFHSFGLTAGLLMPLVGGVPVYLYPTPLHYRIVPELVYASNATILFGTDTFLNGYARVAHPYDFARLRMILAGAEPVKERTRQIYMEKFGVRILEGYGVTETAPVLAINTPLANKSGSVGRLAPLMQAKLEPVAGIEDGGRLFVRGPNVMLGYYRAENPGVLEPPAGGWHDTGDIVTIDRQGFIFIKGRAKRFAKIAGEMVSLAAVEALASELWPAKPLVVVSLPDARKGERLALLTSEAGATREAFNRFAKGRGATELMVPADVFVVDAVPLLGSGKPDYVSALQLAKEIAASNRPKAQPIVAAG